MANLEVNLSEFRGAPSWPICYDSASHVLRCSGHACTQPLELFGDVYPMCPERWRVMPRWQAVVHLYNASKVSPLSGYPDRYLAWVTHAFTLLEYEFIAAQNRAMER